MTRYIVLVQRVPSALSVLGHKSIPNQRSQASTPSTGPNITAFNLAMWPFQQGVPDGLIRPGFKVRTRVSIDATGNIVQLSSLHSKKTLSVSLELQDTGRKMVRVKLLRHSRQTQTFTSGALNVHEEHCLMASRNGPLKAITIHLLLMVHSRPYPFTSSCLLTQARTHQLSAFKRFS